MKFSFFNSSPGWTTDQGTIAWLAGLLFHFSRLNRPASSSTQSTLQESVVQQWKRKIETLTRKSRTHVINKAIFIDKCKFIIFRSSSTTANYCRRTFLFLIILNLRQAASGATLSKSSYHHTTHFCATNQRITYPISPLLMMMSQTFL